MHIGGIDEAGRGPVIGPMVMAIASIKKEDEFKLQALGIKDSKLLTPKKRAELYKIIKEICRTAVVKVFPEEIDEAVNSGSDNLNWLEARCAVKLITIVPCNEVVLDCPSTNLESYKKFIKNKLKNKKVKLVVEHKADLNHLIVGAASIIAKVERDLEIEKIKKEIGVNFGSGYSSDPETQRFVQKHWDYKDYSKYMRKSWDTWKKHHHQKSQKSLGEF
ncbi:MAG: ribonuclease HII [Nanoarchaeota archaeon]|nr:ribonuclease HII [Nanoarchaeota archaeon]MBU1854575.1 ribonuclease HII [Nanoarchaeota archaeon]